MSFIIKELDVKRSRIKEGSRRRCPGMKRVLGQGRFSFRCHRATNERKREREREGDTQKRTKQFSIK